MNRERALKIVLVLVGLLFLAGVYPLTMSLWQQSHQSHSGSEAMMLSVYVILGIFLLLAARTRSQIEVWSPSQHGRALLMPLLCSYRHSRLRANVENCWSPWLCWVSSALRWSRSRQQSNRRGWRLRLVCRLAVSENPTSPS